MQWQIDTLAIYGQIVHEQGRALKAGSYAAQQIEHMISRRGYNEGSVIGSVPALRRELRVGHRTLRQAFRILESRGACRMRRGPGGGLIVARPTLQEAVRGISTYLNAAGVEYRELLEALRILDWLAREDSPAQVDVPALLHERQPRPGMVGLISASSPNVVLALFSVAIATAGRYADQERRSRHDDSFDLNGADGHEAPSRATALAARIAADVQQLQVEYKDGWLGTEELLCDRYSASLVLLRQALCILETDGIVGSRRGRGGGVMVHDPHPGRAIDTTVAYLSREPRWREDVLEVLRSLHEVTGPLAAARWSDRNPLVLEPHPPASWEMAVRITLLCYRAEWEAMRNRALELMARAISAYMARHLTYVPNASQSEFELFHSSCVERIRAIQCNDLVAARAAITTCLELLNSKGLYSIRATVKQGRRV